MKNKISNTICVLGMLITGTSSIYINYDIYKDYKKEKETKSNKSFFEIVKKNSIPPKLYDPTKATYKHCEYLLGESKKLGKLNETKEFISICCNKYEPLTEKWNESVISEYFGKCKK